VIPRPLALVILTVVTCVWAVVTVAPYVMGGPQPSPMIHFVFTALVGSSLALKKDPSTRSVLDVMARVTAAIRPPDVPPAPEPPAVGPSSESESP
jgi:hypothetical protein